MNDIKNFRITLMLNAFMAAAISVLSIRSCRLERRVDAHKEYLLLLKRYVEASDSVMIDRVEQQKAYLDIHLKNTAQ